MIKLKKKYSNSIPNIPNNDWSIHDYWEAMRYENMTTVSGMFECMLTLGNHGNMWKMLVF